MQRKLVFIACIVAFWLIAGFTCQTILTTDSEPAHAPSEWSK